MRGFMNREIFADTTYLLGIKSLLFAVLVDHIDKEKIKIKYEDFERKRRQFWNCGQPCYSNFSKEELSYALDNLYKPYIYSIGKDNWLVDIKGIIENYIDTLDNNLLAFCGYEEIHAKIFCLFFLWCGVSMRIFDHKTKAIASMLKCNWMLNPQNSIKHNEFLFNIAKKIKPNGNNIEWFKIKEELSKIEFEKLKTIFEDGEQRIRNAEEIEKLFEEELNSIKAKVLIKGE